MGSRYTADRNDAVKISGQKTAQAGAILDFYINNYDVGTTYNVQAFSGEGAIVSFDTEKGKFQFQTSASAAHGAINRFSVNGKTYSVKVHDDYMDGGRPWHQQYRSNTTWNSDLPSWDNTGKTISAPASGGTDKFADAFVTANKVYIMYRRSISSAYINTNGIPDTFEKIHEFGGTVEAGSCCMYKQHLYVFAIITDPGSNSVTPTIFKSKITNDGNLEGFTRLRSFQDLDYDGLSIDQTKLAVIKNNLYIFSQRSTGANASEGSILSAKIYDSGETSPWDITGVSTSRR
jgi:hypothetical protein